MLVYDSFNQFCVAYLQIGHKVSALRGLKGRLHEISSYIERVCDRSIAYSATSADITFLSHYVSSQVSKNELPVNTKVGDMCFELTLSRI